MAEDAVPDKEQPLARLILCCTSILPEMRAQLAATAAEMGAIHKFDLTSEVTHLIVGETSTPKYRYVAKERSDIKILRPEWIEAVRASWMLGEDTDLRALEEKYRFPTLGGLAICITGFEDLDFRNQMQEIVTTNGAEFRRDLTKSVTHLIARVAEGQKHKFATMWNINVVSLKWLEESLERGMALEESLYDPGLPFDQQGVGAWNRAAPTDMEKRPKPSAAGNQRPRKLRRVASVKLEGQNDGIWTDIMGNGPASADQSIDGKVDRPDVYGLPDNNSKPTIQEQKSFASETTLVGRQKSITQDTAPLTAQESEEESRGIWHGSRFLIHGFNSNQTKVLKSHLFSQGARIVTSMDELVGPESNGEPINRYILIPYNLPRSQIPDVDEDVDPEPDIVTDMWIEKCLHGNAFVPPEAHITSTPFPKFPIHAFSGMRISSTGFSGIDLLHLSKLVMLMGATYDEYLTPNSSVLLCYNGKPNPDKLRHVHEWNVPAVVADWLWISVQTGERKQFEPYIIPYRQRSSHVPVPEGKASDATAKKPQETTKPPDNPPPQTLDRSWRQEKSNGSASPQPEAPDNSDSNAPHEESGNAPQEISPSPFPSKSARPKPKQSTQRPPSNHSASARPETSGPLETAISDLLKQRRSGNKPSNSEEKDSGSRPQKRRQLLGRVNSNSSALAAGTKNPPRLHTEVSRASSIDTMNEDGYGKVVDGLNSPSTNANSNAPSSVSGKNTEEPESEQSRESRLDILRTHTMFNDLPGEQPAGFTGEDDSNPQMTQLGYDDPDAVAMREKIMQHAERLNDGGGTTSAEGSTTKGDERRNLVIGRLQDHESSAGWGGGKRTRSGKEGPGRRRQ